MLRRYEHHHDFSLCRNFPLQKSIRNKILHKAETLIQVHLCIKWQRVLISLLSWWQTLIRDAHCCIRLHIIKEKFKLILLV